MYTVFLFVYREKCMCSRLCDLYSIQYWRIYINQTWNNLYFFVYRNSSSPKLKSLHSIETNFKLKKKLFKNIWALDLKKNYSVFLLIFKLSIRSSSLVSFVFWRFFVCFSTSGVPWVSLLLERTLAVFSSFWGITMTVVMMLPRNRMRNIILRTGTCHVASGW